MALDDFAGSYLPRVEAVMRDLLGTPRLAAGTHYAMMQYHLGWLDESFQPTDASSGKGVRPLLCLLSCRAAGGDVARAIPAAAALELLHNFSLVHDDVQDISPTRRHRPTVWRIWGEAQAINVGDALFTLAYQGLLNLSPAVEARCVLEVLQCFTDACLALTEGQHLDLGFETTLDVTVDDYLTMIRGKTAALLAASAEIGARLAGVEAAHAAHFRRLGESLGLAFQIQDDILGIWGDEAVTGKSAASDILTRKKSLPVLVSLAGPQGAALRPYYSRNDELGDDDVPPILDLLETAGARAYAAALVKTYSEQALAELQKVATSPALAGDLEELVKQLLGREA